MAFLPVNDYGRLTEYIWPVQRYLRAFNFNKESTEKLEWVWGGGFNIVTQQGGKEILPLYYNSPRVVTTSWKSVHENIPAIDVILTWRASRIGVSAHWTDSGRNREPRRVLITQRSRELRDKSCDNKTWTWSGWVTRTRLNEPSSSKREKYDGVRTMDYEVRTRVRKKKS